MQLLKKILPDVAAIVGFVAIVVVYFFTPLSDGLVLSGHDNTAGIGAGQERSEYNKTHSEPTYWTNSLFGGMPTYQLAPSYPTSSVLYRVQSALGLWMPTLLTYVFLMLLGFYIMLRAFDFKVWMAALGAVIWAFSSYFFIIIGAGHLWKVYALAYLPALIGGIVMCLRGRLATGFVVTAIFAALEIVSNHPQMTYYFIPVIAVVMGCVAWQEYKTLTERALPTMTKRLAVALLAGIIGVCINITSLYHTYEYSKHTMRGGCELVRHNAGGGETSTDGGLNRDYITQWSYGIDETWSLLVPKINGGSSMDRLDADKTAMAKGTPMYRSVYQSLPQYFGDQPFTAGPVYVGAIVLLLAVLALIICRGPLTWGLLALTLLSIGLSWGHNWQWFTDLFIDYVPLYSKFRTVSSILVVAEFTIPLLAILALKAVSETEDRKTLVRPVMIAGGVVTALAVLIALMPEVFVTRFVSLREQDMLSQAASAGYIPQDMVGGILSSLETMRQAVVSADAWRSAGFCVAAIVALFVFLYRKMSATALTVTLLVLCLADMWTVNKRYLNDGMFSKPKNVVQSFAKSATDEEILQDKALDYRVLNLAGDTFNENETSYWHKSVGGYSAVKMQRYQDLINYCIAPQINNLYRAVSQQAEDSLHATYDVINMLNTRWVIMPLEGGETLPLPNPYAFGNAWFVGDVRVVADADEEIDALGQVNLRETAVVNKEFAEVIESIGTIESIESIETENSSILMTAYEPNCLTYEVKGDGGLAVFSEVYYPGWRAYIGDEELPVVRANYVLRAVPLPAGEHTLTLRFDPQTIHVTESVAWGAWLLLAMLTIGILIKRKIK